MEHSIIIPHRNRNANLADCLASIARSAEFSPGVGDFEVIVVDNGSAVLPDLKRWPFAVQCEDISIMPIFNKPRLLNIGLAVAAGRYITFLDADAIVGPLFMAVVRVAKHYTRLAYRVRYVPANYGRHPRDYAAAFKGYDSLPRGYEAYGTVDRNPAADQDPAFWPPSKRYGNSQFTIERRWLRSRGLQFDEEYVGRGFSDLDFIRRIAEEYGDVYTCGILTKYQCALVHRRHQYGDDWQTIETSAANRARYKRNGIQ